MKTFVQTDANGIINNWATVPEAEDMPEGEQAPEPPEGWAEVPALQVAALAVGSKLVAGVVQAPLDTRPRHITVLAFRNRFTPAERVAMDLASIHNSAAPAQVQAMAAGLRDNERSLAVAAYVDLARVDTRAGVQALPTSIIAAGRAAVILDAPIAEAERYKG